ncbi:MAG: hypothetical protein LBT02_02480 [Rickettsiales bacterium]|nr:hypothetical protein [Rickettsiales bacterium]
MTFNNELYTILYRRRYRINILYARIKRRTILQNDFTAKLPQNGKELVLFIAIISILSVNTIAPLITFFEFEFSFFVYKDVLKIIPSIWLSVVVCVLLTFKPSEFLTDKITEKNDSFKAKMTANILMTVFLMSILMTIVGTWIGARHFSLEPITHFFYKWPRNFAISFAIESLFAQPIARFFIFKLHQLKNK